uniref:Protein SPT2 homolog n=1 Tax=Anopheles culicifacies TaxID=139723 RepID=A0A182MDR1_9DIPT
MDYRNILNIAKQNAETAKTSKGARCYTAEPNPPPTKVAPEKKVLSENIKKFLAKKEEEERQAAAEKHLKAQELMAKRGGKGKKKIEKMLKVIKSANKSVLDDANDAQESALGTESLEDDYGYTSAVASQYYEKMMDKYKNTPTESMFTEAKKRCMSSEELARAKARVKNAIVKEQEEQHGPRSRKSRTSKADGSDERYTSSPAVSTALETKPPPKREDPKQAKSSVNEERKPVVRKPNVPPPPNFSTLLKIAETKQFEPIKLEVSAAKKREEDRPLTSKEKKEYEERKAFMEMKRLRDKVKQNDSLSEEEKQRRLARLDALRAAGKLPGIPPLPATSVSQKKPTAPVAGSVSNAVFKIPKRSDGPSADPAKNAPSTDKQVAVASKSTPLPTQEPKPKHSAAAMKSTGSGIQKSTSSLPTSSSSSSTARNLTNKQPPQPSSTTSTPQKSSSTGASSINGKSAAPAVQKSTVANGKSISASGRIPGGTVPTKPANGKQQQPGASLRPAAPPKRPPPAPVTQTRQFPPPDVQRSVKRREPVMSHGGGRPTNKKRRIIDSDSEYDSEMDDFIDDDECEEDYSSAIKDIFGYDKSRYRDEYYDEDDDNMESSYAQQMREEYISKKIGLLEDLEDMRMEEEEKRRKSGGKKGAAPKKK